MANIEKNETRKNIVELKRDINTGMETVTINGIPMGILGYTNDADKKAALAAIQKVVDNSDNTYDVVRQLRTLAALGDNNVDPDEEIDVDGYPVLISYAKKEAYSLDGEKIADMEDLKVPNLPKDAIKAILSDRAKLYIAGLAEDDDYDEYDD